MQLNSFLDLDGLESPQVDPVQKRRKWFQFFNFLRIQMSLARYRTNVCDYIRRTEACALIDITDLTRNYSGLFNFGGFVKSEFRVVCVDPNGNETLWQALEKAIRAMQSNALIERWDLTRISSAVLANSPLALRVLPESVKDASSTIERYDCLTREYLDKFKSVHNQIRFVGMSVYKEVASAAVPLDKLYIPLRVIPEGSKDVDAQRTDPVELLNAGSRHVILGDPGSGKSTLLKFLALLGTNDALQKRFQRETDQRIPILVILRQYADELKSRSELTLLEYAAERALMELGLSGIDCEFLEYQLCVGGCVLLLDGIDELPNLDFKQTVRQRVSELLDQWPANTVLISSRLVGYESEARFDSKQFRHHEVAPLLPDDIRAFVKLWYEERVAGTLEQKEHFNDLLAVLNDKQNEAIRDLATNPLLLTIICLVHRIDGELPDERVVLYHKCTETLLNTWHSWKFRGQDRARRSSTEKRNRGRMEFIAYCMQGLFDSTDPDQRAVVPLEQLAEILQEYLEKEEELSDEEAKSEADLFLRFVRERAGLLIEVGDGQYSFVHLTFQEYLAAAYLRKAMETIPDDSEAAIGIQAVWALIERNRRHANVRWHETIRLLVASLDKVEAQRYMVEKIRPENISEADYHTQALLAGGILLDQVDGVLALGPKITMCLLQSCIVAENDEEYAKPLNLLIRIIGRCPEGSEFVRRAIALFDRTFSERNQTKAGLVLVTLGWSDSEIEASLDECVHKRDADCFKCFLANQVSLSGSLWDDVLRAGFYSVLQGPNGALLVSLAETLRRRSSPSALFYLQCLGALRSDLFGSLMRSLSEWQPRYKLNYERFLIIGQVFDIRWDLYIDNYSNAMLDRAVSAATNQHQHSSRKWFTKAGGQLEMTPDLSLNRARASAKNRGLSWEMLRNLRTDPTWCASLEQIIRTAYFWSVNGNEDPRWWSAFKTRRLNNLVLPDLLPSDLSSVCLSSLPTDLAEGDRFDRIGTWLMFDIGFYLTGEHGSRSASPFETLAQETCELDFPLLRIVHCLRDIAYGDESRSQDLMDMIKSEDPAYQKIFRDAYWID